VGSFAAGSIPAFDNTNMYILRTGNLVAVDPSGNPDRWARGGGMLVTPPAADNGAVFAGASNGKVYGFSPTGRKIWTAVAGQGIGSDGYSGLAIGNRMLVLPAGHVIAAFGD
jgi:outer membrane protein assembly factor BamB